MERDTPVIGLFSNAECYDIAIREVLPKFEVGQETAVIVRNVGVRSAE